MSDRKINPERLHTLGLPLSNGRKPDYDRYEPVDRHGKTEYDKWGDDSSEGRHW